MLCEDDVAWAIATGAADALHFKVSRVGGLSAAVAIRARCAADGIATFWEASGGSTIANSAAAHIAVTAPPGVPHAFWPCTELNATVIGGGGPTLDAGVMKLPDAPGLGVAIAERQLPPPVRSWT